MRLFLLFILMFHMNTSWAQPALYQYYDTLFYTSGMIRPCTIEEVKAAKVYYEWTNSKGKVVKTNISEGSLKYYVDYTSSGDSLLNPQDLINAEKTAVEEKVVIMKTDTVLVPEHHLSVNPFSPFLLGISLDYMYRIGYEKKFAIHVPFRYFTWFNNETLIHTGVGFNFIPYNTDRFSMYMGLSTQFYHLNRKTVVGFPITVGFAVNLNKLLTLNGYVGAGPFLGNPEMWELPLVGDAHLGLGFKFGELFKTTNTYRVD
jgi:hypothetical protein